VNAREEHECREIMESLSHWDLLRAVMYLRWLLVCQWAGDVVFAWRLRYVLLRRRILVWLHRTQLALPWTYRLIEEAEARLRAG
jgi:hypothetical protein